MPYVNKKEFKRLKDQIIKAYEKDCFYIINPDLFTPGQLNYIISSYLEMYLQVHGTSYEIMNDVVGVLECAKQEFFNRKLNPYEREKKKGKDALDPYEPFQSSSS